MKKDRSPPRARRWARARNAAAGLAGLAAIVLGAAPADAQLDFLTNMLMPESQEGDIARAEHPKIVAQFGGEYADPALSQYVNQLAATLGRNSDRPDLQYRVTILNSPVINAFALPAGYLYITRGLLALADDEAELAGVLGHEIGHVTARHTANRYSRGVLAQGVVGILGVLARDTSLAGLAQLAEPAAMVALQSFSREQENEADLLGIRTMAKASYNPQAMATFLESLDASTALDARLAGRDPAEANRFNLFATHPRTADRVRATIAAAQAVRVDRPQTGREAYLRRINGLVFGDDPEQGIVRGQAFIHPTLGIRFEVPQGFRLLNGGSQVTAQNQQGGLIRFDMQRVAAGVAPDRYIAEDWAAGRQLGGLRPSVVSGFAAASATTVMAVENQQPVTALVVAIRGAGETMYRFLCLAPQAAADGMMPQFAQTVQSFRQPTDAERAEARPLRIRTVAVQRGETVERIAERMANDGDKVERFRTLNSLSPAAQLKPGQMVKIVTE